jgi:hypothetical protein
LPEPFLEAIPSSHSFKLAQGSPVVEKKATAFMKIRLPEKLKA